MMGKMTSNKPYLIRGIYDWIVDNQLTPYLLVDANAPGVQVPQEFVNDGRIILNISPNACRGLHIENDRIVFTARFSGIATQILVTPYSVWAIYAKENGRGMEFADEEEEPPPPAASSGSGASSDKTGGSKPALKLVK